MKGTDSKPRVKTYLGKHSFGGGCIQQGHADNTTTVPSGCTQDAVRRTVTYLHVNTISTLWLFMPSSWALTAPTAMPCYQASHALDITCPMVVAGTCPISVARHWLSHCMTRPWVRNGLQCSGVKNIGMHPNRWRWFNTSAVTANLRMSPFLGVKSCHMYSY